MNLTPMSVLIAGAGGVLIYSAVRGYDPRDVVRSALSGDWPPEAKYTVNSGGSVEPYAPGGGAGKSPIPPMNPNRRKRPQRNRPDDTPDTFPTRDSIPTRAEV